MGSSGSVLHTDADDYAASLPGTVQLLATGPEAFRARLTWMELGEVHLLSARETVPRIAYVTLPATRAFAIFPAQRNRAALICDGIELRVGDIVFHRPGARFHQRSTGAAAWGSIALTAATLRRYGSVLTGLTLVPSSCTRILRPPPAEWRLLLRLHAEAIRIAETRLSHIAHPQVARAVEQDLIWALVGCLSSAERLACTAVIRRDAAALARFEEALLAHPDRPLGMAAICKEVRVSEHLLRAACLRVLGMTPAQYLRLRRLRLPATRARGGKPTATTAAS